MIDGEKKAAPKPFKSMKVEEEQGIKPVHHDDAIGEVKRMSRQIPGREIGSPML